MGSLIWGLGLGLGATCLVRSTTGKTPGDFMFGLLCELHGDKSWKSSRISPKGSHNNYGKLWKSSRILRVKPIFHFSSFFLPRVLKICFFGLDCFTIPCNILIKKSNFRAVSGGTPVRPLSFCFWVCYAYRTVMLSLGSRRPHFSSFFFI